MRALLLATAVAVMGGGCVLAPAADPEWAASVDADPAQRLVFARDRVSSARWRERIGWGTVALAAAGTVASGVVSALWYHLDQRDHWDAPWELYAGLGGVSLGTTFAAWWYAERHEDRVAEWESAARWVQPKDPEPDPPPAKPPAEKPADAKPADAKPADPPKKPD